MEDLLRQAIAEAVKSLSGEKLDIELTYPNEKFGDYATNAALKVAAAMNESPRALAEKIAGSVQQELGGKLKSVAVAGPGFINFTLSDKVLIDEMGRDPEEPLKGEVVVAEYSDPNPFKVLHAGHLYTSVVGDAMANLLSQSGAEVHRINYGGDVGLHVARALWGMVQELGGENPEGLSKIAPNERSIWISQMYVNGNTAYESNDQAKAEIDALNKRVYEIQANDDHESALAVIYWTARGWSYEAFDQFYNRINIIFDRVYTESEAAPIGLRIVREQQARGVFEESEGAVIFRGEKYGLHTRVFINSQGLPTYEAKEIGLSELKKRDFEFTRSVIITGNDQLQYLTVLLKAIEQFDPEVVKRTTHLTHGIVKLLGGKKMSSRIGNVLTAESVLDVAAEAAKEVNERADDKVVLAAVKYAFLKQALGGDIVYDPKESVNILGNSGPYLQYAHARARSILRKSDKTGSLSDFGELSEGERGLVLILSRYAAVIKDATSALAPHILCGYLYELCQEFNSFYETNRVIGDDKEVFRLGLIAVYADRLKQGLELLGISAPDQI